MTTQPRDEYGALIPDLSGKQFSADDPALPRDEYGAPIPDLSGKCFSPAEWDGPSLGQWWDDLKAKSLIDDAFAQSGDTSSV